MASKSLSELHPVVREKAMRFEEGCAKRGVNVLIYCTYRSGDEQDALYALGRTVKSHVGPWTAERPLGKTVTKARAGQSFHQFRCAFDAVPLIGGKPGWNADREYGIMGQVAKECGLDWSWLWKKNKEKAHFQYTGGLTIAQLSAGAIPK